MRILHWFPNYTHGGGVANAVTALAHAQASAGAEIAIASVDGAAPPLYGPQAVHRSVDVLKWTSRFDVKASGLVMRPPSTASQELLRSWRPDIVHLHAEFAPDNVWPAKLFNVPLVLTFHGALHPEVFVKSKQLRKRLYVKVASRSIYRRIGLFIALSPAEAHHIRSILPERNIRIIPLGAAAISGSSPEPCQESHPHQPAGGSVSLVFVGRLDTYTKGLDLVLQGYGAARHDLGSQLGGLTLVGPDWKNGRSTLERLVDDLDLRDSVCFTGEVPLDTVSQYLMNGDIYVQLSRHDAFPLSVVEALVAGKPAVLSSAIGTASYREIAGLPHLRIVPPRASAMSAAVSDLVNAWPRIRTVAKEHREALRDFFDWERIANEHLAAY